MGMLKKKKKIALAIQGLLWFHTNFRIICSSYMEYAIGILIGITLALHIVLGTMAILTTLILPIHEHSITFHLFILSLNSFINDE